MPRLKLVLYSKRWRFVFPYFSAISLVYDAKSKVSRGGYGGPSVVSGLFCVEASDSGLFLLLIEDPGELGFWSLSSVRLVKGD